jgi:hypothetical protein
MWSFDVIGEIVFSKRLGFLDTSSDVEGIMADCVDHQIEIVEGQNILRMEITLGIKGSEYYTS